MMEESLQTENLSTAPDRNGGESTAHVSDQPPPTVPPAGEPSGSGKKTKWNIPKRSKNDSGKKSKRQKRDIDSVEMVSPLSEEARAPQVSSSDHEEESDDSPDPGSDSEAGSDKENSSDSSDGSDDVPPPKPSTSAAPQYSRFDPGAGDDVVFHLPNDDMVAYVNQMFTSYVPDKKLKETICESCPVPQGVPALQNPRVDDYIPDIFNARKQDYGRYADENWMKVGSRILDIMGPLSKVWTILDSARVDQDSSELDLYDCLDLVEKCITLVGSSHQTVLHFRKQGILFKMTKDMRKAKQLLKLHDPALNKSKDKLFGKAFYKQLNKSAKVRKASKEISNQLGEGTSTKKSSNKAQGGKKQNQQPFQSGPPSGAQGGGRKVAFHKRGKSSGNRGKFLFKFFRSNKSKITRQTGIKRGVPQTFKVRFHRGKSNPCETVGCVKPDQPALPLTGSVIQAGGVTRKSGGSLQGCLHNWEKLTADPFILQVVKGLRIPFVETPLQEREPHPYPLNEKESLLVEEEIQTLIQKGAIAKVDHLEGQFVSPLFLVPKKDGTQRPVINLKKLNSFVEYNHFKMEGIHLLKDLLQPQDFMVKVDLKDAYFSVPMHKAHQKFLRFRWKDTLYQFQCMPFGLGPAPRVFTKIMKPIVSFLRRLGIRLIIYLDDIILLNQSKEGLEKDCNSLLYLLTHLGFATNWKKSFLTPTRILEFLGFTINTETMMMSLPEDKVTRVTQKCHNLIKDQVVKVRHLAEVVGMLNASVRAILPAPLHYRQMQMTQAKALLYNQSYETRVSLPPEVLHELRWWIENIRGWNGKAIMTPSPDLVIETDASLSGWGAVLGHQRIGGVWNMEEKSLHINVLELRGALFAVRAFAKDSRRIHVHLRMDNVSAVTYIQKMGGTRSRQLLQEAQTLWDFCLQREILLSAEYLPGRLNIQADWESRNSSDPSDWQLGISLFKSINQRWGPLQIDLFANRHNSQLKRYISWKPDPYAEAVDAFQLSWKDLGAYLFPPFSLIPRCLAKVYKEQATVVIVTPTWQSQPWYPTLLEMVVDYPVLLPGSPDLLRSPRGEPHPLIDQGLHLAVWKVSGNKPWQEGFRSKLPVCWQSTLGEKVPRVLTSQPGDSGVAGVSHDKLIHFVPLWKI